MAIRISELITSLSRLQIDHGDLPLVGGEIFDDTSTCRPIPLDSEGRSADMEGSTPVGFFLAASR